MFKIDIDTSKIEKKLSSISKTLEDANKKTDDLYKDFADKITADAQKLAPVDTGILRSEGRNEIDKNKISILFGGLASKYADIQHDNENFQHPKGGQDHFLYGSESSAWSNEKQDKILKDLSEKMGQTIDKELDK